MNKQRYALLAALLLVMLSTPLTGQIRFGVKGGISTTDLSVGELEILRPGGSDRLRLAIEDANYGVHAGLMIRLPLGETFLLQPEIVFNSNTVEYEVEDLNPTGFGVAVLEEKFQYLDIPLLLGAKFGPLRLMAGPEGRVFINSASDLFRFDDYDQTFDDLTISFLGGIGLDLWNLTLDVRYEGNFDNFGDHITFGSQQFAFSSAESRWIFSVGLFF